MDDAIQYDWRITGHHKQLAQLEKDLREDHLAHAYLFAGPDHIGKFSIAKKLANILQCENNYCHTCYVCREIGKGYHADTIEIVDNGESIKIEEIREILHRLSMSRQGRYKILLIQNIERMTVESGNAMLKTLEDPPGKVIFLLTTGNMQEVLPTILSRVRSCHFTHVAEHDLMDLLQQRYPLTDSEHLKMVHLFAMGKPGKAITFMENTGIYNAYKKMYNDVEALLEKPDRIEQFSYISELLNASRAQEGDTMIKDFLTILLTVLRQTTLATTGDEIKTKQLLVLLQEVQKTYHLLKRNVNKKLLLENLMLRI